MVHPVENKQHNLVIAPGEAEAARLDEREARFLVKGGEPEDLAESHERIGIVGEPVAERLQFLEIFLRSLHLLEAQHVRCLPG